AGEVAEERRKGRAEGELHRVLVDDGNLLQGPQPGDVGRRVRGIDDAVEVELDGVGVERRAVVEGEALAEVEGVLQSVRGDVPTLGQHALDVLVRTDGGQRVVDAVEHVQVRAVPRVQWVERVDVVRSTVGQRPTPALRLKGEHASGRRKGRADGRETGD